MKKINVLAASLFIAALVVGASSFGSMTQAQANPLTCSVNRTSVPINLPITITAIGGNGVYTWSSANFVLNNPTTNSSSITLTYTVPGNYVVTVMSDGFRANCLVAITAIESPDPGSLIEAPAPGLPNTGELPL
jgi:hypothetical protein